MFVYAALKDGKAVYVGQTIMSLAERKGCHFSVARKGRGGVFGAAIRKHGEDEFEFVVIEHCDSHKALDECERKWIAELAPKYNKQRGGRSGFDTWNKGRKEDRPEVIKRISEAAKNRVRTKRGTYSDAHKAKIRDATRARTAKPFVCEQTGKVYFNKIECAQDLGLNHTSLLVLLSGKTRLKSLRGYTFKYIDSALDKPTLIDLEARQRVTGRKQGEQPVQRERLSEWAEFPEGTF
jgi:group I intron endonuclease